MVERKPFSFAEQRNLVQEILHKPERTEPAADKTSQQTAEYKEKSQYRERNLIPLTVKERLQRADGTGSQSARTGITVQAGNTDIFQVSPIDLSAQETIGIAIGCLLYTSPSPRDCS